MKKRRIAWLLVLALTAALFVGIALIPAGGSSPVYLMAVNDTVKPLPTVDNMPMIYNGELYIPYTMLSKQETGIDLRVSAQYSTVQGILSVSNSSRTVNFNTRKNTAHASTGENIRARAVMRNSMAYIPLNWLIDYFPTLDYSLVQTDYGILLRLTNRSAVLTDQEFVDAADSLLRNALQNYHDSLITPEPSVSVSPTVPLPTPGNSPSQSPTAPTPTESQTPAPKPPVCLAFKWGNCTAEMADVLAQEEQSALFLFPVSVLAQEDDLIRRLIGQGHQVGLLLEGGDIDDCLTQLKLGRQLMADIARSPVLIVSADDLNRNGLTFLREADCAVWRATLRADGLTGSAALLRLDNAEGNRVEITCDWAGVQLVKELLPKLTEEEYPLYSALATNLE